MGVRMQGILYLVDRIELADFLCRARTRLAPRDVGLYAGPRRRTPGLRREEVAQLTGMSTDYYTRLEQRRGSYPSRQMLTALARPCASPTSSATTCSTSRPRSRPGPAAPRTTSARGCC
ncbi:hypothetical protein GCM10010388_68350 [Streptomyces mauvecolor]